jgi:uncharacterized coiled-coil protein SlyX
MTDDLVKRLDAEINATYGKHPCGLLSEAKNRIERLETEVRMTATYDRLMQKLADDQAQRIEQLEAALRPFANKFLYPDDSGVADYIRDDEDWDEENNNQMIDDVFIPRGWIRVARAALGEKKDG